MIFFDALPDVTMRQPGSFHAGVVRENIFRANACARCAFVLPRAVHKMLIDFVSAASFS
jgi:hypothetical protein